MSYNGAIDIGLLGDYDALPDIQVIADGIEASLQELLEAARSRNSSNGAATAHRKPAADARRAVEANGSSSPAPILPAHHTRATRGPAADMRAKRGQRRGPPRKRDDRNG
jgi:hypothetical protein